METISQYAQVNTENGPASYLDALNAKRKKVKGSELDWQNPESQVATSAVDTAGAGSGVRISGTDVEAGQTANIFEALTNAQRYDEDKQGGTSGQQEFHGMGDSIKQYVTGGDSDQLIEGVGGFASGGFAQLAADISKKVVGGVGGIMRYQQQAQAQSDKKQAQNIMKTLSDIYDDDMKKQEQTNVARSDNEAFNANRAMQDKSDWVSQYKKGRVLSELSKSLLAEINAGGHNG